VSRKKKQEAVNCVGLEGEKNIWQAALLDETNQKRGESKNGRLIKPLKARGRAFGRGGLLGCRDNVGLAGGKKGNHKKKNWWAAGGGSQGIIKKE